MGKLSTSPPILCRLRQHGAAECLRAFRSGTGIGVVEAGMFSQKVAEQLESDELGFEAPKDADVAVDTVVEQLESDELGFEAPKDAGVAVDKVVEQLESDILGADRRVLHQHPLGFSERDAWRRGVVVVLLL